MSIQRIQFIDNRSSTFGDIALEEAARSENAYFATAFVKASGLSRFLGSFARIIENGGTAEIIFGLDFRISEPAAISMMLRFYRQHPEFGCYAFSDPRVDDTPTFHPKLYILE